jgi:hypothetical protein
MKSPRLPSSLAELKITPRHVQDTESGNLVAEHGQQHLAAAAQAVRNRLADRLTGWDDGDIATFAQLIARFNQSRG